jgi:hypothetical protein
VCTSTMRTLPKWLMTLIAAFALTAVRAQSQAALQKMLDRYTLEQIELMYDRAHYRFVSLMSFYSRSFEVNDDGMYRAATEEEIALVDISQYDALRTEEENVIVYDATLTHELKLLCRNEFEQLVWDQLNEEDRAAYLAFKQHAITTTNRIEY